MFRMQSIAQSGGWRIVVSVKILADFSRRRIRPGVEFQPVRSELSFGRLPDAHFCQKKTTSNHGALRVRNLNEKENGRCTKYLSPRRSNIGGEGRNAIILSSSSPRSLGGAPASVVRGDLWIALLGPSVEKGIVGIGPSVAAALRAFDTQDLDFLGPARDATKMRDSTYSRA